jgi:hypothetical protein
MRPHTSSDEAHRIAFGFSPPDELYFTNTLEGWVGRTGHTPRRSRTERQQRAWQTAEEFGFGTCRGERKANAARGLDDPGGDFQETRRSVANSAVANSRALGMASRTVSINQ